MSLQPRYRRGDRIGGRYLVHQVLKGGMGEVYLCMDLEQNYPYALKTFQTRYLTIPHLRQLFAHEVGIWVALEKHPNIVRCFEMRILNNQPFMLLEWVAGEEGKGTDLRSWLRHGPLDVRTALDFTIDICRGLIHAQVKQPGIVHRDLKPENILLTHGRLAKITDFGLVSLVKQSGLEIEVGETSTANARHTLIGAAGIVGTPPYMAPELWCGESEDTRTDIYAVGCILYELLTGTPPYQATTLDGWQQLHSTAVLPMFKIGGHLPSTLNTLLADCIAKQPDDRFATPTALLEEVSHLYRTQFSMEPRVSPAVGTFTPDDYVNRGVTYDELGWYSAALADYTRAIGLGHNHPRTYTNRGNTYTHMGRYEEALADYARAIVLNPDDALIYTNRGKMYYELKDVDLSLADLTRAIAIDPTLALAYYNRGCLWRDLRRTDEALADFTHAIVCNPADIDSHLNRGVIYAELRQFDSALDDYYRALTLDPTNASVYNNIGIVLMACAKPHQALSYYERAAQLGHPRAAQFAELLQSMLGLESADEDNATQQAFEILQRATSRAELQRAVTQFPFMTDPQFLATVAQAITEQVPLAHRASFEQRLAWLHEIAGEQR